MDRLRNKRRAITRPSERTKETKLLTKLPKHALSNTSEKRLLPHDKQHTNDKHECQQSGQDNDVPLRKCRQAHCNRGGSHVEGMNGTWEMA